MMPNEFELKTSVTYLETAILKKLIAYGDLRTWEIGEARIVRGSESSLIKKGFAIKLPNKKLQITKDGINAYIKAVESVGQESDWLKKEEYIKAKKIINQ